MYPHYCLATTGTALTVVADVLRKSASGLSIDFIPDFHNHHGYITLLRSRIKRAFSQTEPGAKTQLLFSAHSIPESIRRGGDPYIKQIERTCQLASEGYDYLLSYQSATGPVKWVGPDTLVTIDRLAADGIEQLVIVPISFVSDNIETLYDIDIVMQKRCLQLGMRPLLRAPMFNGEPDFVEFVSGLVRERMVTP
jgi:ferrochelatase